jgi:hypothetical protein
VAGRVVVVWSRTCIGSFPVVYEYQGEADWIVMSQVPPWPVYT